MSEEGLLQLLHQIEANTNVLLSSYASIDRRVEGLDAKLERAIDRVHARIDGEHTYSANEISNVFRRIDEKEEKISALRVLLGRWNGGLTVAVFVIPIAITVLIAIWRRL